MKLEYGWQGGKFTLRVVNKHGLKIAGLELSMSESKKVREAMSYGQPEILKTIEGHVHESPAAGRDGMSEINHLLICLEEECLEVGQAVSKALRFGLDDHFTETTPREMIRRELHEVSAVFELLAELEVLPMLPDRSLISAKKEKLKKMLAYAREKGTLRRDEIAVE